MGKCNFGIVFPVVVVFCIWCVFHAVSLFISVPVLRCSCVSPVVLCLCLCYFVTVSALRASSVFLFNCSFIASQIRDTTFNMLQTLWKQQQKSKVKDMRKEAKSDISQQNRKRTMPTTAHTCVWDLRGGVAAPCLPYCPILIAHMQNRIFIASHCKRGVPISNTNRIIARHGCCCPE